MFKPEVIAYLNQYTTPEGLRRYAPSGEFDGKPCACTSLSTLDCEGECGCQACNAVAAFDRTEALTVAQGA